MGDISNVSNSSGDLRLKLEDKVEQVLFLSLIIENFNFLGSIGDKM